MKGVRTDEKAKGKNAAKALIQDKVVFTPHANRNKLRRPDWEKGRKKGVDEI